MYNPTNTVNEDICLSKRNDDTLGARTTNEENIFNNHKNSNSKPSRYVYIPFSDDDIILNKSSLTHHTGTAQHGFPVPAPSLSPGYNAHLHSEAVDLTSNTGTHYAYSTFTPDEISSSEKDVEHLFNKEFSSSNPLQEQDTSIINKEPQSSRMRLYELIDPRDHTGTDATMSYRLFDWIMFSSTAPIATLQVYEPQLLGLWNSLLATLCCIGVYFLGVTLYFYPGNRKFAFRKTAGYTLYMVGMIVWFKMLGEVFEGLKLRQK